MYGVSGPRTISVTLVDEDGTHTNAGSKTLDVAPPAEVLTVAAGVDRTVNEGTLLNQTITFTDDTDTGNNGRTYTVNWGDGQTTNGTVAAGNFDFNIGHTYADNGSYNVTVSVNDDGAQQGSDSFAVTVNNTAPTVTIGATVAGAFEGASLPYNFSYIDAGSDTAQQFIVHWGDGSADTVLAASGNSANANHTYADGSAVYAITVDVVDEDGTWLAAGSLARAIDNVAPSATVTGADSINEGSIYTLTVGLVNDPGADTRADYRISWGDGSIESFTPAQWAAANGSFTHTYADGAATRTITVSTTDEDGTFTLGSKTLTVANVAPDLAITGAAATNEGAATRWRSPAATPPASPTR